MPNEDRMLKYFEDANWAVESLYKAMAKSVNDILNASPERTVALRKLLESRDAALRAREDDLA